MGTEGAGLADGDAGMLRLQANRGTVAPSGGVALLTPSASEFGAAFAVQATFAWRTVWLSGKFRSAAGVCSCSTGVQAFHFDVVIAQLGLQMLFNSPLAGQSGRRPRFRRAG